MYLNIQIIYFRINRFAQFIGEIPAGGLTGAKCIGMGFIEISNFYAKQAQKVKVLKLCYKISFIRRIYEVIIKNIEKQ